jgi:hypothetical protein
MNGSVKVAKYNHVCGQQRLTHVRYSKVDSLCGALHAVTRGGAGELTAAVNESLGGRNLLVSERPMLAASGYVDWQISQCVPQVSIGSVHHVIDHWFSAPRN